MQRPRRTSEFHDDPGSICRQSRPRTVAPSPSGGGGTAVKFASRTSRLPTRARSSSLDRGGPSNNAFLTVPGGGVAASTQRGVTPQRTPMSTKSNTQRVLFTAEKSRGVSSATNNGPLHNDKKWVQEQTQRITEYLLSQPTISGLSSDFLQRGLRQMSIKQFVAIVNFFLGHIWGKRYVVGNNHVEDIIQILQKLQYPHSLNKSWLKTPNTQHSFGNVVVLFDYFMDFVPPFSDDDVVPQFIAHFELQDPQEMNASRVNDDMYPIPDLEFQRELLLNSEEGFLLWDKRMDDDFNCLQQETCNLLIKKSCNFQDATAIDDEIEKLKTTLKCLQDQSPKEDKELLQLKSKLTEEFDFLCGDMKLLNEECHNQKRAIKQLSREKIELINDVDGLEQEITTLQESIKKQLCTVEQRDQLMSEQKQLEHMLAIEERTLRDLEGRNHNQQVLYARILKQFTDRVESFNAFMREIAFSNIPEIRKMSSEDLQLPLRPEESQLQKLIPILEHIKEVTQKIVSDNKEKTALIQQEAKNIIDDVETNLETKLNSLRSQNSRSSDDLEKLYKELKEEMLNLNVKTQELENELSTADKSIEQLQQLIEDKRKEIDKMKAENETTMQRAEKRHENYLSQKRAFIQAYDDILEQTFRSDVLKELAEQVEEQKKQLEEFQKELCEVEATQDGDE